MHHFHEYLQISDSPPICYESKSDVDPLLDAIGFLVEGVALLTVATTGLLGNGLAALVLIKQQRLDSRSPFNALLIALLGFDSALLGFHAYSAYLAVFRHVEPAWYKTLFPLIWHPLKNVASTCCVYIVVAVAIERSVSRKLRSQLYRKCEKNKLLFPFSSLQVSRNLSASKVQTALRRLRVDRVGAFLHRQWPEIPRVRKRVLRQRVRSRLSDNRLERGRRLRHLQQLSRVRRHRRFTPRRVVLPQLQYLRQNSTFG